MPAKNKKKINKIDAVVMIILPLAAFYLTMALKTGLLTSTLLFFGAPALYLSLKNRKIIIKSAGFAVLFALPLSLFVDIIAALNGSWIVPQTIFPFKFFGVATAEVYIFSLLWIFFLILFYEHFFDREKHRALANKKIIYLLYFFAGLIILTTTIFYLDKTLLLIPYFFFFLGITLVAPPIVLFLRAYPAFIGRFVVIALYFFFVTLLFEIGALAARQWIYPNEQVIGYVDLFRYRFPIEEFIFWLALASPSVLSYYEFFADDRKL